MHTSFISSNCVNGLLKICTLKKGYIFNFKDKSQTAELWEKLNFGNKDQNVKFRKLMGIKVSIIMLPYIS